MGTAANADGGFELIGTTHGIWTRPCEQQGFWVTTSSKQQLTRCLPFLWGGTDDEVAIALQTFGHGLHQKSLVACRGRDKRWTQTISARDATQLRCVRLPQWSRLIAQPK